MFDLEADAVQALVDKGGTAARSAARAGEAGLRRVDSSLSGGAPKPLVGERTLMAGGAEKDVADSRMVLRHVVSNITHMGPTGTGQTAKLINQVLCGRNFLAVAEATKLAQDAGVDAARTPQALKGGLTARSCRNKCRAMSPETTAARAASTTWSRI